MTTHSLKKAERILTVLACIIIYLFLGTVSAFSAGKVSLKTPTIKVNIGDDARIEVLGADTAPSFTSDNVNIATVSPDGTVTGVSKGTVNINVKVGTTTLKNRVTVVVPTIRLTTKNATIYHGGTSKDSISLRCVATGAYKDVTWQSDNTSAAVVDEKGVVKSKGPGVANITATANGISASCKIEVKETSISFNEDEVTLCTKGTGNSYAVKPNITGTSKSTKWVTSDKNIATVSGGRIVGKKPGHAVITATANGVSANINVRVSEGLGLSAQNIVLYTDADDSFVIKTNAARGQNVTWSSSDSNIAAVENGKVIPIAPGEAYIYANVGGSSAWAKVTVKKTEFTLNDTTVELRNKYDTTCKLGYSLCGKNESVKWSSSNAKIATVSNGTVTARSVGTAVISAESNGIKQKVTVKVKYYTPTLTLNYNKYTLYNDGKDTVVLKATCDGPSREVEWNSDNYNVAWVVNGKIIVRGEGKAIIKARSNGATAVCELTVLPSEIKLSDSYISLDKGETDILSADITGKSRTCTMKSENTKVATVTSAGVIKAVSYGETNIAVSANGVTEYCHIHVTPCEHVFGREKVTLEATCTTVGQKESTCTLCGYVKKQYTEKKPHEKAAAVRENEKAATCTQKGKYEEVVYCKDCKRELSRESRTIDMLPHRLSNTYELVKESTCYDEGMRAKKCLDCGAVLDTISLGKLSHEYAWRVTSEKTDTANGYESLICTKCGEVKDGRILCIHRFKNIVEERGAKFVKCNDCGEIVNPYNKFNGGGQCPHEGGNYLWDFGALGTWVCCKDCAACLHRYDLPSECTHDYFQKAERLVKRATETEDGLVEKVCLSCGEAVEQITVHAYKAYTIDLGNGNTDVVYGYFDDMGYAGDMVDMTNDERGKRGKSALTYADFLQEDCNKRAVEVAYSFNHTRPNGQPWHTIASNPVNGENLGWGYQDSEAAMRGWIESTGHWQNMLTSWFRTMTISCFHQFVFEDGKYIPIEHLIWVQWFSAYDACELGLESEDDIDKYLSIHQTDEDYMNYRYLEEENQEDEEASEDEKPTEDVKPAEDKKPTEDVTPAEDKKPTEDVTPAEDKKPTEDVTPAEDKKPTEDVTPAEDKKPTEDVTPAEDKKPTEDVTPTEDNKPSENVEPASDEKPSVEVEQNEL